MRKFLVILLLGLASCHFREKQLSTLWFFSYTNGEPDASLTPACFINLQTDGNYTRDFGEFEYGKWKYKDDRLMLTNQFKKTSSLKIRSISLTELQLIYNDRVEVFEGQPRQASPENDPFSKENNLWRIHANRKESEADLKNRLENHIKFWELYFEWALDKDIKSIDVRSLPTPIKIYGNGFTIKPLGDLPLRWKSFFYDDQDCLNANSILENVVTNEEIAWPHTDNKYKAFISVFQQLEVKIKNSNFAHLFTPPVKL